MYLLQVNRIWAMMLRHLWLQFRDESRLINFFYWPFFDVLIWSFMSTWAAQNNAGILFIPVVGAFFWQAASRTSADIATSFMDELLSKNLTNIFSSPLRFAEYMLALMLVCLLRLLVILLLCGVTIWCFTGFNMLMFGWWLIPLLASLFFSGIIMACLSCATLLCWGMRAVEFIWVIAWSLSAFIGAFYPITIMPTAMQMVGKFLPMTYAFTAVHGFVATGTLSITYLGISFLLNVIYAIVTLWLLSKAYNKACNNGLSRLEVD